MTSGERVNLLVRGIRDMCANMDVFVVGGGLSTSFSDIVPAVVAAVIGRLETDAPLTKPAKHVGDVFVIFGETSNDGNDTLYRAGLADVMRPAIALFKEERITMDASLDAMKSVAIHACSDLGAAGIGAAVSESVRYGGLGARIDLAQVPVNNPVLTPEEILICETQARMMFQVSPKDADAMLKAAERHGVKAAVIGEVTEGPGAEFYYALDSVARIPNTPPANF
jgi:phosphoribosylformylglycinamidine synthase